MIVKQCMHRPRQTAGPCGEVWKKKGKVLFGGCPQIRGRVNKGCATYCMRVLGRTLSFRSLEMPVILRPTLIYTCKTRG